MRRFLAALVLFASGVAFSGDRLLGVILTTDGGPVNNATTGYGSAGCSRESDPGGAGACAQAFRIGNPALISIQCKDQGAVFITSRATVDAGIGIKLATDQFLTSSIGNEATIIPLLPDGGRYVGGVVAISPLAGASRAECNVFQRIGNE